MLHKMHIQHYICFFLCNNNNVDSLCLLLAEESRISFNLLQDVWVKTLLFSCIYVTRTMICIKYLKPLTAAAYQGHHRWKQTHNCWVVSRETLTVPDDWLDFSGAGHRSVRKAHAGLSPTNTSSNTASLIYNMN